MRYRSLSYVPCLILGVLALASRASAQEASDSGFALDRFDPSERGSDWFVLDSQDYRGDLRLMAGLVTDWAYKPLVVVDADGSEQVGDVVKNQVLVHPGASLVIWERVRVGVSVPVAAYVAGGAGRAGGASYSAKDGAAMGDVRVGVDGRLFGEYRSPAVLGLGVQVHVPTGSQESFTGDGKPRLVPHLGFSGDWSMFAYAVRAGTTLRFRSENFGGQAFGHEGLFAASFGLRLLDQRLLLGPEVWCSTVISDSGRSILGRDTTPVEGLLGAHYALAEDWRVGAGAGTGLTAAFGTPRVRGVFSIEWAPSPAAKPVVPLDSDRDGIVDEDDACPKVHGEPSTDPARHGCPPPPAEPLLDSDSDGIADATDACPNEEGTASGDPKKNGCPPDGDGDGILDTVDGCPKESGPSSDDPKQHGCPLPADTDGDGIMDPDDHCPTEAGPANAAPTKNGCPLVQITDEQVVILEEIQFAHNSAKILEEESAAVLDAVLNVLKTHTEITKVQVEGYTDDSGSRDYNLRLSGKRAAAVVDWLRQRGIERTRLRSWGFGPDKPKAPNDTPEGRQQNRRVEFRILGNAGRSGGGAP